MIRVVEYRPSEQLNKFEFETVVIVETDQTDTDSVRREADIACMKGKIEIEGVDPSADECSFIGISGELMLASVRFISDYQNP